MRFPLFRFRLSYGDLVHALLLVPLLLSLGCQQTNLRKPAFRYDLKAHGLETRAVGSLTASYNQIVFLNNNFILVSINQREFHAPVEPSNVDQPAAKILLFDISRKALVANTEWPVAKDTDSVQALDGERLAIRSELGVQICAMTLHCSLPMPVRVMGPILASPEGTAFVVGGYSQSEQLLFAASPVRELARFSAGNPVVVPGDSLNLKEYEANGRLFVQEGDKAERPLPFTTIDSSFLPYSRFLNRATIGVSVSRDSLLVGGTDGRERYKIPVVEWYRGTALITSATGKRFGIRENTYTAWNSITHFYDIEKTRPFDSERIRILDIASGTKLLDLKHDPRPYIRELALPALSPDGHWLALINHESLEVYEIP